MLSPQPHHHQLLPRETPDALPVLGEHPSIDPRFRQCPREVIRAAQPRDAKARSLSDRMVRKDMGRADEIQEGWKKKHTDKTRTRLEVYIVRGIRTLFTSPGPSLHK